MIVISDSSSLIAVAAVGQLEVLHGLYREVIVPQAVWSEVTTPNRPGATEIQNANWIRVASVANRSLIGALPQPVGSQLAGSNRLLDRGES